MLLSGVWLAGGKQGNQKGQTFQKNRVGKNMGSGGAWVA